MEVTDRPAGTTPPTLGPPAGRPMPPTGRLGRLTSSRRVLLVTVVLGTLVYAALLHYSVEVVFAPLFPYLEYRSPDALLYAATLALAVLSSVVLPRRMGKPSDTALWIIQVSAALPALLCAQYLTILTEPEAFVFGVHVVGTMVLIRLVCAGMPPITFGHRLQNLGRLFWIALVVYAVAIYGLLVVFAGVQLRFVGLLDVYDLRSDFESHAAAIPLMGYLLPLLYNVVNPLLAGRGLFTRNWALFAAGMGGQVLLFLAAGQKSVLFSTVFLAGLAFLYRGRRIPSGALLITVITVGSLLALLADRVTGTIYASSVFIRRFLILPGALAAAYVDIFSRLPQTSFGDSVLRFLGNPYAEGPTPAHIVGQLYIGHAETSANVSIFGHGYLSWGYPGMYLEGLTLGLMLWLIDRAAVGLPAKVGALMVVMPSIAVSSASIFTSILTHGLAGLVVLLAMTPREGWERPSGAQPTRLDPVR